MFELLLVVIGVLALVMLLLLGRSRRSGGDPSSSVQDFHRALTAMEPGGGRTAGEESNSEDGATEASEGTEEDRDHSSPR